MDYTGKYDEGSDRVPGVILFILFLLLIVGEFTKVNIKTDINGIHDSLKFIGSNYNLYLAHSIVQLLSMIVYIALSAAFFLVLRNYHLTLSHFVAFGLAASGLTLMVSSSGSFSMLSISNEYLMSNGVESDIIAINGLVIAELRKNAQLIAHTIEGSSILLLGIYIAITGHIHKAASFTSILISIAFIIVSWLFYGKVSFMVIKVLIILNYLFLSFLFFKNSYKKDLKSGND
jgi:hypothetical protein